MNSIEDTAQNFEVTQSIKQKLQSAMSLTQTFYQLYNSIKYSSATSSTSTIIDKTDNINSYNFSGQHTDIAFCGKNENGISVDEINQIQNTDIRENTMINFDKAVKDGYLNYDDNTCSFTLTKKGQEHINSESFIEQFIKDQKQGVIDNTLNDTVSIKLQGNGNDLNVFQYVDSINLNKLAYDDPAQYKQVKSYFEKCEKYDFVNIDNDIVKPTEKTKQMLKSNPNFNIDNVERITPKNFDKIINLDDYRKFASAKATSDAIKTGENIAKTTQTGKNVAKAGTTVAKAGATATTATATAGVSAGVQAVVELSKAGVKNFNKAMTLNQNKKVKLSNQK